MLPRHAKFVDTSTPNQTEHVISFHVRSTQPFFLTCVPFGFPCQAKPSHSQFSQTLSLSGGKKHHIQYFVDFLFSRSVGIPRRSDLCVPFTVRRHRSL